MKFPKTIYVNLQGEDLNAYEKLYGAVNDEGARERIGVYELKETLAARKIVESSSLVSGSPASGSTGRAGLIGEKREEAATRAKAKR